MKKLVVRFPFVFAILVALSAVLSQIWPFWLSGLSLNIQIVSGRVTGLLIAVLILSMLGWWREAGFVPVKNWRAVLPYLPLIVINILAIGLVFASAGIQATDPVMILFALASFTVGAFIEEGLFRGVVLRAFLPSGIIKAALLSAFVFSLAHLPNMLLGQSLSATALQLVRAFLLGFAFVAPLAITRNIWPLVFLHLLINFSGFLASGNITSISSANPPTSQVLTEIVIFGLLALYSFWQLLRSGRRAAKSLMIEPKVI